MIPGEPRVVLARQGFPSAQADIGAGAALVTLASGENVSWYGTSISDERGSFALVTPDGRFAEYVGDFLALTALGRPTVYVYVLGVSTAIVTPLAVARRAFMGMDLSFKARIAVDVALVT